MDAIKMTLSLLFLVVAFPAISDSRQKVFRAKKRESQGPSYATRDFSPPYLARERERAGEGRRPNIVLVLTDDQDVELGSLKFMPKLARHMSAEGATFSNGFVSTPMCCPSRSSLLTGLYVHNHAVYTNNDNCSSSHWIQEHEPRTFATYLQDSGYSTAYFGKYLNKYTGQHVPPGWTQWQGLVRNSRFYNYTLNVNGALHHHGFDYEKDYLPDIITNRSLDFLKWSLTTSPDVPVMTVLSYPGPHGPEDSAPQYQHLFHNVTTHHTPAYDLAPNPDKQWILRETGKMAPVQRRFTDLLMTKRLQTLQSIDDGVEKLVGLLKDLGQLDNTYVFYTSDHGYHLGQYGLVKGKAFPFDVDTKVPLIVRGPGIPANTQFPQPVVNIDLAPTFLDAGGLEAPAHMDGRSMLDVFRMQSEDLGAGRESSGSSAPWRHAFLIERGKMTLERYMKVSALANSTMFDDVDATGGGGGLLFSKSTLTKRERVEIECKKPRYQLPCDPGQKWFCKERKSDGVMKMRRCPLADAEGGTCRCGSASGDNVGAVGSHHQTTAAGSSGGEAGDDFVFSDAGVVGGLLALGKKLGGGGGKYAKLAPKERNDQKDFLRRHVSNADRIRPRFLKMLRGRRRGSARRWRRSDRALSEEAHLEGLFRDVADQEIHEVDAMVQDIAAELRDLHQYNGGGRTNNTTTVVDSRINIDQATRGVGIPGERDIVDGMEEEGVNCVNNINSVICSQNKQQEPSRGVEELSWDASRLAVKQEIQRLRAQLHELKQIRRYLHIRRPPKKQLRKSSSRLFSHLKSMSGLSGNDSAVVQAPTGTGCSCAAESAAELLRRRREKKLEKLRRKQAKREKLERKLARKLNPRKADHCKADVKMNCFSHDSDHWKTPPLWTEGPFCACTNSNNNTYWCVRNVNTTHNYLYCEYVTGMVTYFDLRVDPHQLRNLLHTLTDDEINYMHTQVTELREYSARDVAISDQRQKNRAFNTASAADKTAGRRLFPAAGVSPPSAAASLSGSSRSSPLRKKKALRRRRSKKKLERRLRNLIFTSADTDDKTSSTAMMMMVRDQLRRRHRLRHHSNHSRRLRKQQQQRRRHNSSGDEAVTSSTSSDVKF